MSKAPAVKIHRTAIVSADAELAPGVEIGPYVVIEGRVRLGPGCILKPHVHLCGPLTLGAGNLLFTGVVLGEGPQHLKYKDEPTSLEIGEHNVFREFVTIHRGTSHSWKTRIGSHNYFMVNSHVGHDCVVGNHCILANGALVAGHCTLADNVYLSGNCAVHQFVRIGRLVLLSGCAVTTKDIPPFLLMPGRDTVAGVNVIGMKRAGLSSERIQAVRRAFRILYREGLLIPAALTRIEDELGRIDVIGEFVSFIRQSGGRGITLSRARDVEEAA
jgi:UDP-N-acetylglucosamine acyltransferase